MHRKLPWAAGPHQKALAYHLRMTKYRVDDTFKMIGAFWRYGEPDQKFPGTLTSREGVVEIMTAPVFSVLDKDAVRKSVSKMNRGPSLDLIPSICGFTTDNDCTLFASVMLDGGSLTHFPKRMEITANRYRAGRTVMGLHLESAGAATIDGGAFYLTKIHHLLPTPWTSNMEMTGTTYVVPSELKEVFGFTSTELDAEVTCEVFAGGNAKIKKGAWIKSVPRIKIMPRHRQSVDWFFTIAFRLENFFTLFLGTSVELKHVQLFQDKDEGWVVQKLRRRTEKVNFQTWVRCPYQMVQTALGKWLAVPVDRRPVELTVLGMIRKSEVFDEAEFLSLAQALEGFGRINFASTMGKRPSFAQLIQKTYDLLSVDFALELLGERAAFTRTVVDTRNYYTHLGNPKGNAATQNSKELFLLNKRLHAFLRCVMLIDLGVTENYLREPILYQAKRWIV